MYREWTFLFDRHSLTHAQKRRFMLGDAETLTHPVLARASRFPSRIVGFEFVIDFDIQITLVLGVGFVGQEASEVLTLFNGDHLADVEDGLFPMCVFCVGTGRESDWFVAGAEIDIEPGNDGMDEVVPVTS